jgi:hypothetical protein
MSATCGDKGMKGGRRMKCGGRRMKCDCARQAEGHENNIIKHLLNLFSNINIIKIFFEFS